MKNGKFSIYQSLIKKFTILFFSLILITGCSGVTTNTIKALEINKIPDGKVGLIGISRGYVTGVQKGIIGIMLESAIYKNCHKKMGDSVTDAHIEKDLSEKIKALFEEKLKKIVVEVEIDKQDQDYELILNVNKIDEKELIRIAKKYDLKSICYVVIMAWAQKQDGTLATRFRIRWVDANAANVYYKEFFIDGGDFQKIKLSTSKDDSCEITRNSIKDAAAPQINYIAAEIEKDFLNTNLK